MNRSGIASKWVGIIMLVVLGIAALACAAGGAAPSASPVPESTLEATATLPPPTGGETGGTTGGTVEATTEGVTKIDPCALFTQEAVESLFGGPAQPGLSQGEVANGVFNGFCIYTSQDGGQHAAVNIDTTLASTPAGERLANQTGTPVPDVGDAAVWTGSTLVVAKGPWMMVLTATLAGGTTATAEQLTPIAQQIVAGLP